MSALAGRLPSNHVHFAAGVGHYRRKAIIWALGAFLISSAYAAANAQAPIPVDGPIEHLKAGEYIWAPEIAPDGPVTIIVSLKTQRAYAYRNGVPIGVSTVSTGKAGHDTPTGIFTILQKEVDHKSNLYANAPMPFMQRLTWTGIAMHAGNLPGYPASHGCVRLPLAFAKLLFEVTKLGLTVVITNDPLAPEVLGTPPILTPPGAEQTPARTAYRWQPERSPTGPLSIVVSGRDRRIVVMRRGVEIGSSGIDIDGAVITTEAFTFAGLDGTRLRWLRLRLPGQANETTEMPVSERARGHMPEAFRLLLAGALVPGSTLLVTRDSLRSGGTGKELTLFTAEGSGTGTTSDPRK
ncbi:L,D-transpeptidase [Sphingobium sufflavum]|uniref:L,D-transpeptidase n=1 Tax=Sphingobium sufflavum TaxID=1129547 RepID=UPI001F3BDC29|nr:L,D-transpeptidase [Sphingobium sufflavum]MCE7795365.1 L,D-transpeptidase [Sphingobium sufflavum]